MQKSNRLPLFEQGRLGKTVWAGRGAFLANAERAPACSRLLYMLILARVVSFFYRHLASCTHKILIFYYFTTAPVESRYLFPHKRS